MTAKEYLKQGYKINQRINSKIEMIEILTELAKKCTSTLDGIPQKHNTTKSPLQDIVAKIVDLQTEINNDVDTLVDLKSDIIERINKINNADYQMLLEKRYLCLKSWEQIAADMNYSIRNIYIMHGRALNALKRLQ